MTDQNSSDTSTHQVTADSLAFAIECLRNRALTIVELKAEIRRLKATIARLQKKR